MNVIQLGSCIKVREEDFGALIYNLEAYSLYQINESGKQILDLCREGKGRKELEKMAGNDQRTKEEINQFIAIMIKLGVLEEVKDIG